MLNINQSNQDLMNKQSKIVLELLNDKNRGINCFHLILKNEEILVILQTLAFIKNDEKMLSVFLRFANRVYLHESEFEFKF